MVVGTPTSGRQGILPKAVQSKVQVLCPRFSFEV